MKTGIHSARLLLRRPYKLLLCCLVNLVVILFTVIEGIQMTETRAAIKAAMESRVYTGTVTRLIEVESDIGARTYTDRSPIGEDAVAILAGSPYVDAVQSCVTRTARFGDGKKYVTGDAAQRCMFVGAACGEIMVTGEGDYMRQRFQIRPTYLAAGDPDTFYIGYDELHPFPSVIFSHYDENLETHRDERYFLYAVTPHETKQTAYAAYMYNPPEEIAMYYPEHTLIVGEEPGDEALSDEEFAAKVMREYGLEDTARRLEDLQDMTAVIEIPTLDMLLPWRNNLMRIVSGRALTEADVGKKVCMFPSAMLTSMRKKVGDTVFLAVSEHDLSDGVYEGVPSVDAEYDPADFGPMEEYEVVGTYANDSSGGLDGNTTQFFLNAVLIPRAADEPYEPVNTYRFSFTVHKENYESYLFETEPLLSEAGYTVIMARPEYADVEEQFEDLRSKTFSTFLTAGLALAVGLAIAAGSLVLFWRSDYLTERRLGAWKREAAGLYVRAYGIVAAVSLALSALAVFAVGRTKLVPFLAAENLSPRAYGNMVLFACAELILYALIAFCAVRFTDRRKFGG